MAANVKTPAQFQSTGVEKQLFEGAGKCSSRANISVVHEVLSEKTHFSAKNSRYKLPLGSKNWPLGFRIGREAGETPRKHY